MGKDVCIHGHFYQPPRKNPWLETIEVQDPAFPYRALRRKYLNEIMNIRRNDRSESQYRGRI